MSQVSRVVVKTVTGETYGRSYTAADIAKIAAGFSGGVKGMVDQLAEVLGTASDKSVSFKLNDATIGWVVLNPRHIVAIELHGSGDVE